MDKFAEIKYSISRMRANGTLTDKNLNQTIFFHVDKELNLSGVPFLEMSYEVKTQRQKRFAEYAEQLTEFYSTPPNLDSIKNRADTLETFGTLESFKVFGEAFGEQAAIAIGANIPALQFALRNAYWIAPALGALYFAPQIIATVKTIKD